MRRSLFLGVLLDWLDSSSRPIDDLMASPDPKHSKVIKKFMKIKPKLDNTIEGEKCAKAPLDYLSDPLINCLLYHFGAFKEVSLI